MKTRRSNILRQIDFDAFIASTREYLNSIRDEIVVTKCDNGYRVFDRFEIRETLSGSWVIVEDFSVKDFEFTRLANAMTFCVFLIMGKFNEAAAIHHLDERYTNIQFRTENLMHLLNKYKPGLEEKEIIWLKLTENAKTTKYLKYEMQKYVNLAKYLRTSE